VSLPCVKRRIVNLTTHPYLIPKLKKEWNYNPTSVLGLYFELQSEIYLTLQTYFMEHLTFVTWNTFVCYIYSLCDQYINILGQHANNVRYNIGIKLNLSLNYRVKCNVISLYFSPTHFPICFV